MEQKRVNLNMYKYIKIIAVTEQPSENHWSYPLDEIPYIIEQIKDGDRTNGYEFHLYDGRLYEVEKTVIL